MQCYKYPAISAPDLLLRKVNPLLAAVDSAVCRSADAAQFLQWRDFFLHFPTAHLESQSMLHSRFLPWDHLSISPPLPPGSRPAHQYPVWVWKNTQLKLDIEIESPQLALGANKKQFKIFGRDLPCLISVRRAWRWAISSAFELLFPIFWK